MQPHTPPINIYHRWAYIDEINAALNNNLDSLSNEFNLPINTIKMIRTLFFLDAMSISIFNSFTSPEHPDQIDKHKQQEWKQSLSEVIERWHEILHLFMEDSLKRMSSVEARNTWDIKHATLLFPNDITLQTWEKLKSSLIDVDFITSITNDQHLDPIKKKYAYIEPFFRGIHQTLEVAMNVMIDITEKLRDDIKKLTVLIPQKKLHPDEYEHIVLLREQMHRIHKWWVNAAEHILLLSRMDTGSYAEYRQALLGTSGGDSRQLRYLKTLMTNLHFALPKLLHDTAILTNALSKNPNDLLLSQLLASIREAQAASSDFWMRHFTLTANTIGIIRGSQGLPVEKLISFAVAPLMKNDSLLQSVGNVGKYYAQHPEATIVRMNNMEKIMGNTIYPHVKDSVSVIGDYHIPAAQHEPLLDALDLRALEPNDAAISPYASWFDTDIHTNGLQFGMHSFGVPLVLFKDSVANTANRLLLSQNNYWEIFFQIRIPQFQKILFRLLDITNDNAYTVTVDANATAFLERLLSALPDNNRRTVLTTDQEFLTVNRTLAGGVAENKFDIQRIHIDPESLNLADAFKQSIQKIGNDLKLIVFSHIMSNTQISMTAPELIDILNAIPSDVPVIIDAVQGVFNVPIAWNDILKNRNNVYLIGSGIKHGRSTSGLGFLIHPSSDGILQQPKKSGWCAYLTGISAGRTTDHDGKMLYDDALQWLGGTPANVFALELFINTWDAILATGENLQSMHRYTQSLHATFFSLLSTMKLDVPDRVRRIQYPLFSSNTIVFGSQGMQAEQVVKQAASSGVHFDHREGCIRLGFGIQHGINDVEKLVGVLKDII